MTDIPSTADRPQFVIRLTRGGDDPDATIGYAIVEQTRVLRPDDGEGDDDAVMLDEMRRLFDLHAAETLAALPLPGGGDAHGPGQLGSAAGASVDAGASVEE